MIDIAWPPSAGKYRDPHVRVDHPTELPLHQESQFDGRFPRKDVFAAICAEGSDADTIGAAPCLGRISNDVSLVAAVDAVLAAIPRQVGQFRTGEERVSSWILQLDRLPGHERSARYG